MTNSMHYSEAPSRRTVVVVWLFASVGLLAAVLRIMPILVITDLRETTSASIKPTVLGVWLRADRS